MPTDNLFINNIHGTMIVAMISVRMMKPPVDDIVDVIPMWDSLMSAIRTMHVPIFVINVRNFRATSGILLADRYGMFLNRPVLILMMKMSVVNIIDVVPVADRRMTASFAMLMIVVLVALV